jgi:hypothetical protein
MCKDKDLTPCLLGLNGSPNSPTPFPFRSRVTPSEIRMSTSGFPGKLLCEWRTPDLPLSDKPAVEGGESRKKSCRGLISSLARCTLILGGDIAPREADKPQGGAAVNEVEPGKKEVETGFSPDFASSAGSPWLEG